MTDFIEELTWRGLLHDTTPGTQEQLSKEMTAAYIGFDPTADSLHVGSLSQIMTLVRFQKAGHKPIALVGGATGMVGDPSGKSNERNLLDEKTLQHNVDCIHRQLEKFLDFNCGANSAEMVNNYDWFKSFSFLDFIRDAGKHITVNYMMAKDSVKNRLDGTGNGMSFTEFSYQLIQGYDFYHLYKEKNCLLQMGGSDQYGNITTGTEFIRRKSGGHAFAVTTRLITKADGTKMGKTEGGNVWLDPKKTSPYKFYQFWLNVSDEDAKKYIRFFTLLNKEDIETIETEHAKDPGRYLLQKTLAKDITIRVHSEADYNAAVMASNILFKGTPEDLGGLDEQTFLDVFSGVPQFDVERSTLKEGIGIVSLAVGATIFASNGKAREMITGGGVQVNKQKITDPEHVISEKDLINNKYILVQAGKKNYYLLKV
ncbi:MAG: tyrosyl-tRNA synthetase [Bacteroidetes bacterium]|jgi:tyrosyl-tRNA synthetase|nr:tyrosyl-tRNA synthetase [Bacteroidota bacterium]